MIIGNKRIEILHWRSMEKYAIQGVSIEDLLDLGARYGYNFVVFDPALNRSSPSLSPPIEKIILPSAICRN